MIRKLIAIAVALAVTSSTPIRAQAPANAGLALGIQQVDEGDLAAAVITLEGVIRQLTGIKGSEALLSTAHLYLGIAHVGLSQFERAKAEMREAWLKNKGLNLDPKKFPPRVIQTFEEAKGGAKAAPSVASPAAAGPAAEKKGGGGKGMLILGGLAAAGGAVALSSGGKSSPIPAPTPAPTPRPTPQILASGAGLIFSGPGFCQPRTISTPSAGVIQLTASWTLSTSQFRLAISPGTCPGTCGPYTATVGPTATKPLTLTYAALAAGNYCTYVEYPAGTGSESFSYQVVFTRQ